MLIFALKHKFKENYYLLIEDGLPAEKVNVISPSGEHVNMDEGVFPGEPLELSQEKFIQLPQVQQDKFLSVMQEKEIKEQAQLKERQKREEIISLSEHKMQSSDQEAYSRNTRIKSSRTSNQKSSSKNSKNPISRRIEWSSEYLIFYKHKIDPLPPSGIMVITVGSDKFKLTKSDFEKVFNDVVMSPQYRNSGHLQFRELPSRILVFRIP